MAHLDKIYLGIHSLRWDMPEPSRDSPGIKSNRTLFRIIESIRDRETATITELSDDVGVAKSTVHRHVSSLREEGYVIQEGNQYRLGLRFLDLGIRVRNRRKELRKMKSTTRTLADETGELVSFMVEENGEGVFLYRERGDQGVESAAHVGLRTPLHTTAAGKALFANLPDGRIHEIIDEHGLPARTEKTITDRETFLDELDRIVEENLAFSTGEHTLGLASVGAPVVRPDGEILGGLSVAGPTHRMSDERLHETIPQQLLSIINEFELNITYG